MEMYRSVEYNLKYSKGYMQKRFSKGAFLLLATMASLSAGNVIHVPGDQPTIQAGIGAAANGDTVLVAAGIYYENINFNGKAITVTSEQGAGVTIIDGQSHGSVATFATSEGPNSTLSGFTLQNGQSGFDDGGVRISSASPTIQNNIIRNNSIGISVRFGSPLIQGNTVLNNSTDTSTGKTGGGIRIGGGPGAQVINNVIENNILFGGNGAGISLFAAGTPTISGNIIRRNKASGLSPCAQGGGLWIVNQSDALIVNNLITGNSAGCGGGIYWLVPSGSRGPFLINNTITANTAPQGAGVFADGFDAQAQLINNIVAAPSGQTAVYCGNFNNVTPPAFRSNDVFGDTTYGGICSDQTGLNQNLSIDPLFFDPLTGDFHTPSTSPVVDTGTADGAPGADQEGNARPVDGNGDGTPVIDIGAYEVAQVGVTLADLTVTNINNVSGTVVFPNPWTWSISVVNHGGLPATFSADQVLLRDNLPSTGVTYGFPAVVTTRGLSGPGTVSCTVTFNDLVCTASGGGVTIGVEGVFVVQLMAIPTEAGTFTNPRSGGVCAADPDGLVAERNETNNNCHDTVVIPGPDLRLTKVVSAGAPGGIAIAGTNVTYLLTVTNNGPSPANNVTITDNLQAQTTFVSCSATVGSCGNQGNAVTANLGALANAAQATVTIVVQVGPTVADGTLILNMATASSSLPDPIPANNFAGPVSFTVRGSADLQLTKVISAGAPAGVATAGSNVTYLMTVTNNGPIAASNVVITDSLPANMSLVSCAGSMGSCFNQVNTVTASLGSLQSGAQATVTLVAQIGYSVPGGTLISNSASVTSSNPDSNPANNIGGPATFTVQAAPPADLRLTKVISAGAPGGVALAGSNVTYLITVVNNGPGVAPNVVVTDSLPANLTFVSCSPSVGNCGFDHLNMFSASFGTLANGAQATLTITMNVGCGIANGSVITNTASVASLVPDPLPANNSSGPVTLTVRQTSPVVSTSVAQNMLTLNNHDLVNVGLSATATYSACPAATGFTVQVFGNEDDETPTAKNEVYSPDAANIALGSLRLRAERVDMGNGRVYVIVVTAISASGPTGFGVATVVVPKSGSAPSVTSILSQAAVAASYTNANNGAMPPGYFVIGDGPVIGPKQ